MEEAIIYGIRASLGGLIYAWNEAWNVYVSPSSYSSSKASAWCYPTSFKRPDIILPMNNFWLFSKCQNTDPPSRNTFLWFSLYKEWPHFTRAAIWQVHISKVNFLSVQYRHNFLCFRQQIKLLLENPVDLSFFLLIRFLLSNLGSSKASMEGWGNFPKNVPLHGATDF